MWTELYKYKLPYLKHHVLVFSVTPTLRTMTGRYEETSHTCSMNRYIYFLIWLFVDSRIISQIHSFKKMKHKTYLSFSSKSQKD